MQKSVFADVARARKNWEEFIARKQQKPDSDEDTTHGRDESRGQASQTDVDARDEFH